MGANEKSKGLLFNSPLEGRASRELLTIITTVQDDHCSVLAVKAGEK